MSAKNQQLQTHIPFGLKDGRMVNIAEVERGDACGCICAECKAKLTAKKGSERTHHFAHANGFACAGGFMTAVHRMAQQIIVDSQLVLFPEWSIHIQRKDQRGEIHSRKYHREATLIEFNSVQSEVWQKDMRRRFDIFACNNHINIAIEIKVTHAVPLEKIHSLSEYEISTFEIDLANIKTIDFNELKELVLYTPTNRKWLHLSEKEDLTKAIEEELEEAINNINKKIDIDNELETRRLRFIEEQQKIKIENENKERANILEKIKRRQAQQEKAYEEFIKKKLAESAQAKSEVALDDDGPAKARLLGLVDDKQQPNSLSLASISQNSWLRKPRYNLGKNHFITQTEPSEEQRTSRLYYLYNRYQSDTHRKQRQLSLKEQHRKFIEISCGAKYEACADIFGLDVTDIPRELMCDNLGEQFETGIPSAVWTTTIAAKFLFEKIKKNTETEIFCATDALEFLDAIFILNEEKFESWLSAYLQLCKYLTHLADAGYLIKATRPGSQNCFLLPEIRNYKHNYSDSPWSKLIGAQ